MPKLQKDNIHLSDFVQAVLKLRGKPFSLKGRAYLKKIYDSTYKNFIMRTGRQVEKSTTISGKMLGLCLTVPYFQALYVSPSSKQTRDFSSQKLSEFITGSDFIQAHYMNSRCIDRVFEKTFINHSRVKLDYALLNADRVRGGSADALFLDELQDLLSDTIPVLEEALSHSDYKMRLYTGTPKQTNSTIEFYWNLSSQTQWLVRCDGCTYWQVPGELNMKPEGLRCVKCGKPLDVRKGMWVNFKEDYVFKGLHLSQLIVPWLTYDEVWLKYKTYSRQKFCNEVLGIPFSEGGSPVTEGDLKKASLLGPMSGDPAAHPVRSLPFYMGVDWATESGEHSFTTVSLGYLDGNNVNVAFIKRFKGIEADQQYIIRTLVKYVKDFNVRYVGVDWGVGAGGMNAFLRKALLEMYGRDLVIEFFYSDSLRAFANWDPVGYKYIVNRTRSMASIFMSIKNKAMRFPRYDTWVEESKDFLNIFSDTHSFNNKLYYDHIPETTDDVVHSINFLNLASMVGKGVLGEYSDSVFMGT